MAVVNKGQFVDDFMIWKFNCKSFNCTVRVEQKLIDMKACIISSGLHANADWAQLMRGFSDFPFSLPTLASGMKNGVDDLLWESSVRIWWDLDDVEIGFCYSVRPFSPFFNINNLQTQTRRFFSIHQNDWWWLFVAAVVLRADFKLTFFLDGFFLRFAPATKTNADWICWSAETNAPGHWYKSFQKQTKVSRNREKMYFVCFRPCTDRKARKCWKCWNCWN